MENILVIESPDDSKIKNKYYKGALYAMQMPDEWILNELPGTGRTCKKCISSAMWRNVLIGYCEDCAMLYKYTRGPGFYSKAVEFSWRSMKTSAYNTYLKDVNLDKDVGKLEWAPQDTMPTHYNTYKYAFEHDEKNRDKIYNNIVREEETEDNVYECVEEPEVIEISVSSENKEKKSSKYYNIYTMGTSILISSVVLYALFKYCKPVHK